MEDLLIVPTNPRPIPKDARRVLVIEDDPVQRMIEVKALQATGWDVSEADMARSGLEIARSEGPDVILLDLGLPDRNGLWVLRALRADPTTADIPVILVTGDMGIDGLISGLAAGAHDYVNKPFHPHELTARVDAALAVGREHRRLADAERDLRKQTEFQDAVLRTVASLVMVYDRAGRILTFNPACERTSGWLAAEVVGTSFWSLFLSPEFADVDATSGATCTAADFPRSDERLWRHRDGTWRTITWSTSAMLDDHGDAVHFVATGLDVTDARAAEHRVAESEGRYRMLVDLAAEGVWAIDADAVTTFANDSLGKLLGYDAAELIGRSMFEFMDDEGKTLAAANVERRREGVSETHDFKFIRRDGTDLWVSLNTAPITDSSGGYAGSVALLSDVSARRSLEIDLRRREAEFRLLAENSTDMISRHAPDGTYLYASPVCHELLGYRPDELVGTSAYAYFHPDDLLAIAASHETVMITPDIATVEYRLRRSDGSYVWLETTSRTIRDAAGAVIEITSASRDITERRHVADALREAEERFRSAFDNAPIGVALTGPDHRTLQVNPALHQMLGYAPGDLVGRLVSSVVHPADVEVGQDQITAMLAGLREAAVYEQRYLHADGHDVWVNVSLTLARDAAGQPSHLLAHVQDITERRRHESQLRRQADRDPLTGLLNRRSFERELNRHTAEVARYGPTGALLLLDLDHFKGVNDTLGHRAGDELIVSVAHLLQSTVRGTDHVARLGGDEFAILIPRGDRSAAVIVADNIMRAIRECTGVLEGAAHRVTASVGLAVFDGAHHADDILIAADVALYQAKRAGRDRWEAAVATTRPNSVLASPMEDPLRSDGVRA